MATTPQDLRRRQEEEKRRKEQQQKQANNKPNPVPQSSNNKPKPQNNSSPSIGQRATLNGKPVVWSGQNYGWQSQATHNKLKDQGKFRTGTQALDRITQTVSNAIPKPIKQHFAAVAADQQRQAARQDKAIRQTAGNRVADLARNDATARTIEAASRATNVDNRIVGATAALAQAAVAKKLMPQGGPQLRANANRAQLQSRSVGAAAKGDVAARTAPAVRRLQTPQRQGVVRANRNPNPAPTPKTQATQVGKPLGGESKQLAVQNVYHGTSQRAAKSIRENGYVPSPTGVYGRAVYTGDKKMAGGYASTAGLRDKSGAAVLRHRIPKGKLKDTPFKAGDNPRVNPQREFVQQGLDKGEYNRIVYKGGEVTPLNKAQADRTLVPANGNIRLSKAQARRAQLKSPTGKYDRAAATERGYFKPGKGNTRFGAATEINNAVKNLNKSGGFTVHTGKHVQKKGFQVAIDGKVLRNPTPQRITKFLEQNKGILSRPDAAVGGYINKRGRPVLEISRRVPSLPEAQRLGKKFKQEGIQDTWNNRFIGTGGNDQLRHTKGAQTKGGTRIGGISKGNNKRLAPLSNTVKKRLQAPTAKKVTPTQLLNRDGSRKESLKALSRNVALPAPRGKDGQRLFTPANRAKAVRRANHRVQGDPAFGRGIRNEAIGIDGVAAKSLYTNGTSSHDIAFGNTRQKLTARGLSNNDRYSTPIEIGDNIKSPNRQKLIDAAKQDMMSRLIDVPEGDRITAAPTSRARGRLYNSSTNGALSARKGGHVNTTRLPGNRWKNETSGQEVKFDPKTMRDDLQRLANSPATLVGRRAGGTSYVTAGKPGTKKLTIKDAIARRVPTKQELKRLEQSKVRKQALDERQRLLAEEGDDWDDYNLPPPTAEELRHMEMLERQAAEAYSRRFIQEQNRIVQQSRERYQNATTAQAREGARRTMIDEQFRIHVHNSPYSNAREMPANVRQSYHQQAIAEVDDLIAQRGGQINVDFNDAVDPRVRATPPAVKTTNNPARISQLVQQERELTTAYMQPGNRGQRQQIRDQLVQNRYERMLQSEAYVTPEHRQNALAIAVQNVDRELQRRVSALEGTLFPQGRQARPQPFNQPPFFRGSISSQGRHRGTEAGLGERGYVFERAYDNELRRRGLDPREFPGRQIADEALAVAQQETIRHFNGTHPPQRDWARTDARTERIRARGGQLQPRRRSGPQTRR